MIKVSLATRGLRHRRFLRRFGYTFGLLSLALALVQCGVEMKLVGRDDAAEKMRAVASNLSSVDLLVNVPQDIDLSRVTLFFSEMRNQAESVSTRLQNLAEIRVEPETHARWMIVEFRRRAPTGGIEQTKWIVAGQVISNDRVGVETAIRFLPRWITNSTALDNSGIHESAMRDGWKALKGDLQVLAREAANRAGLQAHAPRVADVSLNPTSTPPRSNP